MQLSEVNITEFQEKGYTILEKALNKDELGLLHEEADTLANFIMSEGYDLAKDFGCIIEPLSCGFLDDPETSDYKIDASQYSIFRNSILWNNSCTSTTISGIILYKYGTWASQLLQTSNGAYLLNEQYIVKPPKSKLSQFKWHKDSDYYHDDKHKQKRTIACWTALDAVNETNGTIEWIDFLGDKHLLNVQAGSILFMSNQLLHKSMGNSSSTFRRAFMPQFSQTSILLDDDEPVGLAIHCKNKPADM